MRADEWQDVRDLRYEAVRDRTTRAATGDQAAQFVALDGDEWIGSLTVLIRSTDATDHLDRAVDRRRSDVVGVYVQPAHRGSGVFDALLAAAVSWAGAAGVDLVALDVHADNAPAQATYRRFGFKPTGVTTAGPTGPELGFAIQLTNRRADP